MAPRGIIQASAGVSCPGAGHRLHRRGRAAAGGPASSSRPGAAKQFLTAGVTPSFGPLPIDLVLIKFSFGPVALDVSLLSLVGVLVAYLIARSLF